MSKDGGKVVKRFTESKIDWKALAEKVPPEQKVEFSNFKMKNDAYLRGVSAYPAEMPKIDWEKYKNAVPIQGMVDNFKKNLDNLKIEYPKDTLTAKIESQWEGIKKEVSSYCEASNKKIKECEKELAAVNAVLPFDKMTLEDFRDHYPEDALDFVNRPSFWPHDAQEQLGYKPPEVEASPETKPSGKPVAGGQAKAKAAPAAKPAPKK